MIHTTEDFFNKVATEVRATYFPQENHSTTENQNYHKTTKIVEDFSNGVLTYPIFIGRLSKSCGDTRKNIHKIVEKYVVSFGSYQYKPKN